MNIAGLSAKKRPDQRGNADQAVSSANLTKGKPMNSHAHTTSGNAIATAGPDRLDGLIARLGEAYARREELEDKKDAADKAWKRYVETKARPADCSCAANYYPHAACDADDHLMAIVGMIPYLPATSAVGAMVQIAEGLALFERLIDDLPQNVETHSVKLKSRQLERLLFSALRYLEGQSPLSFEDLGLRTLRRSNIDPWTPVEDRIATVDGETRSAEA